MTSKMTRTLSLLTLLAMVLTASVFAAKKAAPEFHEGFEYFRITTPQATQAEKGTIEVVEVFWYGCGHCYRFEPVLHKWLKNKPKNITFHRVPAMFWKGSDVHARAYYTALVLKVVDKVHRPMFDAMHKNKKHRHGADPLGTKEKVKAIFVKHGVKAEDFDKTWKSKQVNDLLLKAGKLVKGYEARSVPLMVVNGKFRAGASLVEGSYKQLLVLVEYLVKKELAAK